MNRRVRVLAMRVFCTRSTTTITGSEIGSVPTIRTKASALRAAAM